MMNDAQSTDKISAGQLFDSVVSSTGLSPETVQGLMLADDDLDALCDAVLARFSQPTDAPAPRR